MTAPILRSPGDFAPQTVAKVERLLELLGEIGDHRYWTLADTFPRTLDGTAADRFLGEERGLESDLFPVLLPSERPELAQMIDAVSAFLNRLAEVTPEQRLYLDLMADSGTYRPELIFGPWPDVLERAKTSPAAAWKVQNLQKRPSRS